MTATIPDLTTTELLAVSHHAQREMPKVGDGDHPTPWDLDHRRLDELLTKWERARAAREVSHG